MRRVATLFLLFLFCAVLAGCEVPVPREKASVAEEPAGSTNTITHEEALKQLPCFGCHKVANYKTGKFPHTRHMPFGVHCNQCHDVKGHRKPVVFTEVCSGCHRVKSFSYPAEGLTVVFSHDRHAKKYGCTRCHPAPFRMKKGTTGITMDRLYKGQLCGACHNGKDAFSSKDCLRCHDMKAFKKPVKYTGGGMPPVVFSHEIHAAMFGCKECHDKLFKMKASPGKMTMGEMYQGKLCGACHNGQMAFASTDCQKCHK